ncbi:MAG TPA: serine/threonine-protein kinase [Tepidisphaeraceae bacterium]
MVLKGLRPGEFAPTCEHCQKRFDLIVPGVAGERPIARAIAAKPLQTEKLGIDTAGVDHHAAAARKEAPANPVKQITGRLGGYEIKKLIGRGTMGSVYLARQLSLSRLVAIKTLHKTLAADPRVLARFTREAYAAAMLQHPNIVQIYDFGCERGIHYFSMEYVSGVSLMQLLTQRGRIEPKLAAGYIVQAARGLAFAHQHGLVHRDVKPDNLLLSNNGTIKVADLGLVRQMAVRNRPAMAAVGAGSDSDPHVTQRYHAMGTPTYMAPEQARDSAVVDGRADIYSLGCSLYTLLVGHPPFEEKTTQAMLEAHATRQPTPPDMLAESVDSDLSDVVMRMMARKPADRFQSMGQVVHAMQNYLRSENKEASGVQEDEIESIAAAAELVQSSPWPKIQLAAIAMFFVLCAGGIAMALSLPQSPTNKSLSLAAVLTLALGTGLTHLAIHGTTYNRPLFSRLRQIWMPRGWVDLTNYRVILPVAVLGLLLYALNFLWVALGLIAIAVGLAAAAHWLIDKPAEAVKTAASRQASGVLRNLRERGVDEQTIRQIVRSESGPKWRGIFESLFGYEAAAISIAGDIDPGQQKWVDQLINKVNAKLQQKWETEKRRLLAATEARWRIAAGVDAAKAKHEAMESSDDFVRGASVVREMAHQAAIAASAAAIDPQASNAKENAGNAESRFVPREWTDRPADLLVEFTAAESGKPARRKLDYLGALEGYEKQSFWRRRFGSPAEVIFGAGPRVILGLIVLIGFAAWSITNKGKAVNSFLMSAPASTIMPLRIAGVPAFLCDAVSNFRALGAGIILVLSSVFAGRTYSFFVLLGATSLLVGPLCYSGPHAVLASGVAAGGVIVLGVLCRRTVE